MSSIKDLLQSVTVQNSDNEFITITNSDYKFWIIPVKNTRLALSLYQPSGIKGKLLKLFLPIVKKNKLVHKGLHISTENYRLNNEIEKLLNTVFKTSNLEFSIFGGTPSKHQKITIQIFKENKILGYCKISNDATVKTIFKQEEKTLHHLKQLGIYQIPECLFCGNLKDDVDVFIQSTIKTKQSKVEHHWSSKHEDFLKALKEKTQAPILFEQSQFFESIQLLEKNSALLPTKDAQVIETAIAKIKSTYSNKTVSFSAYHADFTPWNMFTEKGSLFVFDFEYAKMSYPPFLDYFHYYTQTCIFEKQWNAEKIYKEYCKQKTALEKNINKPDFNYLSYLVDIVSFYLERDKDSLNKDVANNLSIWISLITKF